jgi:hypothetical protein
VVRVRGDARDAAAGPPGRLFETGDALAVKVYPAMTCETVRNAGASA